MGSFDDIMGEFGAWPDLSAHKLSPEEKREADATDAARAQERINELVALRATRNLDAAETAELEELQAGSHTLVAGLYAMRAGVKAKIERN